MDERLSVFFGKHYKNEILEAVREGKNSVVINFSFLEKFDSELADALLSNPGDFFEKANEIIRDEAAKGSYEERDKIKIEVRFTEIPESQKFRIRDLRHAHIGKLITVECLTKRASDVKPEVEEILFECECANQIRIIQKKTILTYPQYCENCGKREKFKVAERKLFDARRLKVEDMLEATMGEKPGSISIFLKNDLTTSKMQKKTDPGSRLKITGILKDVHVFRKGIKSTQLDIYLDANYVEPLDVEFDDVSITPEDEQEIIELAKSPDVYERLVKSLAPSMYGLEEIKESIILQMFGGVQDTLPDDVRIRGDVHILLIGDPSTGKTQLLKLASSIIPRGRYVSGKGATAAGLTATVVKDEEFMGGWVLEAGAIVLANKGVICIDEFDKMTNEDQVNLHEAMSTQTISIAKASISATLPAQTSVIAGANPKFSRFDPYRPIAEQIDIPDSLLSRFDLKFVLRDVPNKEKDERLVDHVIKSRLEKTEIEPVIDPLLLKKYIAYARQNCKPINTPLALGILREFYINLRGKSAGKDTVAITQRQFDALVRLSQASAKVRLATEVTEEDARRAIRLMEYSIIQLGLDPTTGEIDIDKVEAKMSSSQRTKLMSVLDVIDELSTKFDKVIPKDELIKELESNGVPRAEQTIARLLREGELYEPRPNFISKLGR